MSEQTIWTLEIDGSGAVATLDDIGISIDALIEKIAEMSSASSDLSSLDESLAQVSTAADEAGASTAGLDETLAALSTTIEEDNTIISNLNETIANLEAQIATLTMAESDAEASTVSLTDALATVRDVAGTAGEALQSAQGPLMLISMAAAGAGRAFIDMGLKGQQGEALVKGMAGASGEDMRLLGIEALKLGENMQEATSGFYQIESAGYDVAHGGLTVFDNAVEAAKASQSRLGDVSSVITGIMHAYNLTAKDSGMVTDKLVATTVQGKQSFSDLASAIGPAAAQAAHAGISLTDLLSAEAAMTQINPHVRQDAQQLTAVIKQFALGADNAAATASKLGIGFDENAYKSMSFYDKLVYLRQITEGNDKAFAKLLGGSNGLAAAMDVLQGKGQAFAAGQKAIGNSAGANNKAFAVSEQTISAHMDKMGASMSVFATRVMDALGPKVTPIIDHLTQDFSNFADEIVNHTDEVMPILAGLAAVIGTALVGAIASLLISMGPVLLVIGAIGAVVAATVYAFQHWSEIMHQVNDAMQIPAIHDIILVLQSIGAFLADTFVPMWHSLVEVFQAQLVPAWNQLATAIAPLMPLFEGLGILIAGALVVILGIVIALVGGLAKGLAIFIVGLATVIAGIIQVFSGIAQIVTGVVRLISDITTLNFKALGSDLGTIWQGILTMFIGIWEMIRGAFIGGVGSIVEFVWGFIQTIIGYFQNLANILVGHSIVPDMIDSIVQYFTSLPGKAVSAVSGIVGQVGAVFSNLASTALSWGSDMVQNIANGISGAAHFVQGAAQNVAGFISGLLHHSKPEYGPLADDDQWMPDMMELFARGMNDHVGKIKEAATNVAQSISGTISPATTIAGSQSQLSGLAGDNTTNSLLSQILSILVQTQNLHQRNKLVGALGGNINAIINGAGSAQQLYDLLQKLQGWDYEQSQRGVV